MTRHKPYTPGPRQAKAHYPQPIRDAEWIEPKPRPRHIDGRWIGWLGIVAIIALFAAALIFAGRVW